MMGLTETQNKTARMLDSINSSFNKLMPSITAIIEDARGLVSSDLGCDIDRIDIVIKGERLYIENLDAYLDDYISTIKTPIR